MKKINLTQGKVALVDDDDFVFLSQWEWYYNQGYALRNSKTVSGKRKTISMHRVIMRCEKDHEVDHIDGNGLNNQKSNLRICEHVWNAKNRKPSKNLSGYKGVTFSYSDRPRKWRSRITVNGKSIYIGSFFTPEDAAKAYDEKAKEFYGDFAKTNM